MSVDSDMKIWSLLCFWVCWSKRYSVWPLRAYWLIAVVWPRSFQAYRLITAAALYTTGVAPVGGLLDCPRSIVSIGPVSVGAEAVGTQNRNSALPLSLSCPALPYRWVQSFCRLSLSLSVTLCNLLLSLQQFQEHRTKKGRQQEVSTRNLPFWRCYPYLSCQVFSWTVQHVTWGDWCLYNHSGLQELWGS